MTTSMTYKAKSSEFNAWLICLIGSLFFFYEFLQMNMFNSIDHAIGIDFQLNANQLSQLSSVFFISNVLFIIPAGICLDRFSTKLIMMVMMTLCILGTFIFAQTQSYQIAYGARFLTGIGSAFCFVSSIRLAARWFPPQRLAFVTGVIITVAMLGGIVAQTPLALLVDTLGWRHALIVDVFLGLFIMMLIYGFVQDSPEEEKPHSNQQVLRHVAQAYTNRHNILCALYISLMNIPLALLGVIWGTPFLIHTYQLNMTQASFITSLLFLGMIIGSPLFGWCSDRLHSRKLPMLVGAFFAIIIGLFLILEAHLSLTTLSTIFFLLGFIAASQVLGYPAIAENNPPELTAIAVSVGSFATQSGCAIFPTLYANLLYYYAKQMPLVNQPLGFSSFTYQRALWLMPLCFFIAFIISFTIKETYRYD